MKQTAVEWLLENLISEPLTELNIQHNVEVKILAKEMEKGIMEEIREMLVQGALTNMSCASAVVEFDRLTKQQEQ